MVQMKPKNFKGVGTIFCFLYIPHGSDETVKENSNMNFSLHFISHMVQMKRGCGLELKSAVTSFISQMVQMKLQSRFSTIALASAFISHMVQMKHLNQ